MQSELVGYLRKSKDGEHLKLHISAEALEEQTKYEGADGHDYYHLIANLPKVGEILDGVRDVTAVVCMVDE